MSEPITFFSESFRNRTSYYDVHENGMFYRPDSGEEISFIWRDIKYIDDRSGDRVDIILYNLKEVPVKYTTNEFPVFLKTICLRLSDIRQEDFRYNWQNQYPKMFGDLPAGILIYNVTHTWYGHYKKARNSTV